MENPLISPSPHIHASVSTSRLMGDVVVALLPALVVSVLVYGWSELWIICVSSVSCVLLEWLISRFMLGRKEFCGASALVTGLLLAMNLPASTPLWIVLIGAIFAIGVVKMTFGGLGQNIFNPAIAARVFLLLSFPRQMTDWTATAGFVTLPDAVSGATLLGRFGEGGMQALENAGYVPGHFQSLMDIGGSAGEVSTLALLLGFVYLLVRKVVKPWITLSIFATVAAFSGIFCLIDPNVYTGPMFNLLTGGLVLGACFMATDYVTSPMTTAGGIIFGVGIGIIVMLIRYFGAYPEGVSFAILIMNAFVPLIDRFVHSHKFGRDRIWR